MSGGGEDTHWRVANADGSGDHALPEFPSLNPNGPAPSWSPNGNQIVYQGFDFGSEPDTNAVYVENTDGSGSVTPLTGDQGFSTVSRLAAEPERGASQVFTPTSASGTPAAQALPVTLPKPTTVWITKRIFVTKGPDLTVIIGSCGCGGPSCGVSTEGKAKYAGSPAGLLASARAKTELKNKRRQVVVAKGKTTIPGGQSGSVEMKLTKTGIKLLGKQGSLKIEVLVTITIPGQKKIVEHRQVTVVLKKAKQKRVAA